MEQETVRSLHEERRLTDPVRGTPKFAGARHDPRTARGIKAERASRRPCIAVSFEADWSLSDRYVEAMARLWIASSAIRR